MEASPWQLPRGAVVLIHLDETCQSNTELLSELVSQHRLPYVFDGGMRVPFEGDYRMIVVTSSSTKKLPASLHLTTGAVDVATRADLSAVRQSYSQKPTSNIGLADELKEKAQNDFLQRRTDARKLEIPLPQEEDFHRWLTLTRLQARSRGSKIATTQDWERALILDDAMQQTQ